MRVAGVDLAPHVLGILFADGRELELHALQLRDSCPCPDCRHIGTGQRLLETSAIPLDLTLESARPDTDGSGVVVEWSDGHVARFAVSLLAPAEEPARTLWDGTLAGSLPEAAYHDVLARRELLAQWLAAIDELGFAVLRGVPVEPGAVCEVAELFGHVRVTNYGRWFDVRTVADPLNLADTNLGLGLHTDNPYRDPVPGVQLLHCHVASGGGGETVLVDGFHAVEQLRARSPGALALLAETEVAFRYESPDAVLVSRQPVVELGTRGVPRALRVNNRSKRLPAIPLDRVRDWYAAYAELVAVLTDPRNQLELLLGPGDLICFDNERVLHARRAFAGEERLLQGCYADRDGLRSTLALLRTEAQWATA
jgi:gamma-butyrobetaine dioxygenase